MFPRFSSGQGGNVVRPGKWSGSVAGAQSMYILAVSNVTHGGSLQELQPLNASRFTWANTSGTSVARYLWSLIIII